MFYYLLVIFVVTNVVVGQEMLNGNCLDYPAFEYFRYSPSLNYDPKKGIDGQQCALLCSESSMQHAGVVAMKYCLCAPDVDFDLIRSIAKVTDELCKENDDYLAYYRGKERNKIENLFIKSNKEVAIVYEEIYFEISSSNVNIEYSLDFGDGSDHTEWSTANTLQHRYYMSGTFVVNVHARLTEKPEEVVTEITSIKIEAELQNDNVQMTCPTVVEPGDVADCNVTVTVGTQLQMKMDFGDGIFTPLINLPGLSNYHQLS